MSFEIDVVLARGEREFAVRVAAGAAGITALVGPSGQGKTSALDAVAGLLRPVSGRIAVAGAVLFDAAQGIDLPPHARAAGYVFQDLRLFPHLTVRDNLLFGWHHAAPDRRVLGLDEVAGFLDIAPLLGRRPHRAVVAGGQRRLLGAQVVGLEVVPRPRVDLGLPAAAGLGLMRLVAADQHPHSPQPRQALLIRRVGCLGSVQIGQDRDRDTHAVCLAQNPECQRVRDPGRPLVDRVERGRRGRDSVRGR